MGDNQNDAADQVWKLIPNLHLGDAETKSSGGGLLHAQKMMARAVALEATAQGKDPEKAYDDYLKPPHDDEPDEPEEVPTPENPLQAERVSELNELAATI